MSDRIPSISVVLAADHDSELLRLNLTSLKRQCAELGGELVVGDGSPAGLRVPGSVHHPGADVFALRAAAAAHTRGPIIALTEDHCLVDDDWLRQILRAHESDREAVAIGGPVRNGSPARASDRANFLLTFAPFVEPVPRRHHSRAGPATNISFKRWKLDSSLIGRRGHLELEMLPYLHRAGLLRLDAGIRATHVQSNGPLATMRSHFDNGRATAGIPRHDLAWREIARRSIGYAANPARLLAEVLAEARQRPHAKIDGRTAVLLVALAVAHNCGQIAGALRGPGRSPGRLALATQNVSWS